jgi:hypothetical protein
MLLMVWAPTVLIMERASWIVKTSANKEGDMVGGVARVVVVKKLES